MFPSPSQMSQVFLFVQNISVLVSQSQPGASRGLTLRFSNLTNVFGFVKGHRVASHRIASHRDARKMRIILPTCFVFWISNCFSIIMPYNKSIIYYIFQYFGAIFARILMYNTAY